MDSDHIIHSALTQIHSAKFNFGLVVRALGTSSSGPFTAADRKELAESYRDLSDRTSRLTREYVDLVRENARLKAENNFMLRLINEKESNV